MSDYSPVLHDPVIDRLYAVSPHREVLPNGLTLLHRPDFSSDVVSVQVWVRTGSIHEGAALGSGLSHYLEHLLFKGTDRRDGRAISREVHAMGASINAYTAFDRTVYYVDGPAEAFSGALDLLEDIVLHSTLPEAEVEQERNVILREIDMGLDDPDRQLTQSLFETAFRVHPYRQPVIGHRDLFAAVSRDELLDYYRRRYVANNIVVATAGAVASAEVSALVVERFGGARRQRLEPVLVESEPAQLAARQRDLSGPFNVTRAGLAFKVPRLSHPDGPALDILAHALGGGESSLLWTELRNRRRLVHQVEARNWSPGESGLLWIFYVCDPDKQAAVEPVLTEILERVRDHGIDPPAILKAQRQALRAEINVRKTMSGQAGRLGMAEVVIGDIDYPRYYFDKLRAIDGEAVRLAARAYLVERHATRVLLGPEVTVAAQSADQCPRPAGFEVTTCENGARLLLQPDPRLPKVHFRVVFRAGPLFEPEDRRGSSSLLATLMTRDAGGRSADAIAELVEGMGGSFSASGGNNTLTLSLEVLPENIDTAVDLIDAALKRPEFAEETFAVERDAQIGDLREEDDEILDYGFRLLRARFFGDHPFAVAPAGRIADLEATAVADVTAHHVAIVRAGNCVLAVAGDFSPDALRPGLENLLGGLATGATAAPPVVPDRGAALELVESMKREQAVVLQAFPDPGLLDPANPASDVLNELFSGMSSRLFERIRDELGLAYYVGSTRIVGLETGAFVFYAGTHPEARGDVVKEIDGEVARVAAGDVLDDELERCRTRLRAARVMEKQTLAARSLRAALNVSYGLPVDDDADYFARLEEVDASALAAHARTFLAREKRVQLMVGPFESG